MRRVATVLIFAVVLALAATPNVSAECETYEDSRVRVVEGQIVCGGNGPGCTECSNAGAGGSGIYVSCFMTTSGITLCILNGHIIYLY